MRYVAEVRFIASIFPGQLTPVRRYYGPSINASGKDAVRQTLFTLEPVPKGGKPFILPVHDSFEEVLDVMALSSMRNTPQKPHISKPVPVEQIVADLLNEWTGRLANVPEGAKPGVGEVTLLEKQAAEYQRTGVLPDSVVNSKFSGIPTNEYEGLLLQQTRYFEYWLGQGQTLFDEKKFDQISPIMRLAAEWLGFKGPWTNKDYVITAEPCPACTTMVPNTAYVCPQCRYQIREFPSHLAALQKSVGVQPAAR